MTDVYTANGNLDYVRLLSDAPIKEATLVINVTASSYDPSRKTNSTDTKSGAANSVGEISVKDDIDVIDGPFAANKILEQAFYNKLEIERWHVNTDDKNKDGKYAAVYERGYVTEVSQSGNANSNLTKKYTLTVEGEPKRGYTGLSEGMKKQTEMLFRGLDKVTGDDNGGGTEYDYDADMANAVDNTDSTTPTGAKTPTVSHG